MQTITAMRFFTLVLNKGCSVDLEAHGQYFQLTHLDRWGRGPSVLLFERCYATTYRYRTIVFAWDD
jgi:hypothetical protein